MQIHVSLSLNVVTTRSHALMQIELSLYEILRHPLQAVAG